MYFHAREREAETCDTCDAELIGRPPRGKRYERIMCPLCYADAHPSNQKTDALTGDPLKDHGVVVLERADGYVFDPRRS